jgi:hypothetical protein
MQTKLGKMEKLILVYIGVNTKYLGKRYMPRSDLTTGLSDVLEKKKDSRFCVDVAQSVKPLKERGLVTQMRRSIGLTNLGKEHAREIINIVKKDYGKVDWESFADYYNKKED